MEEGVLGLECECGGGVELECEEAMWRGVRVGV